VEAAYRRWLRWYPRQFRREHADELLGVLLAETGTGCRGPRPVECLDLVRGGLSMHLRPRVPRSDRAGFAVVRLMYLVAVVECAVAVTVAGTAGAVRASMGEGAVRRQLRSDHRQPAARLGRRLGHLRPRRPGGGDRALAGGAGHAQRDRDQRGSTPRRLAVASTSNGSGPSVDRHGLWPRPLTTRALIPDITMARRDVTCEQVARAVPATLKSSRP